MLGLWTEVGQLQGPVVRGWPPQGFLQRLALWVPSPSIDPFLVPAPPSLPGPALSPHPVALFGVRPEPAWVCRPLGTLRKGRHTLGSRASESLASVGRLTDQGLTWEMPGAWGCGPWPSSWGVHCSPVWVEAPL